MTMGGNEVRQLRRKAGLSQAELGGLIGISRETVGRIERGAEPIERRTELAVRYVAERRLPEHGSLTTVHQQVAGVLDEAAVRGRVSLESTRLLRAASADWITAGGGAAGIALLQSAQGTIGMLNVSSESDPHRMRVLADLLQLKRAWRAVSDAQNE